MGMVRMAALRRRAHDVALERARAKTVRFSKSIFSTF
jgi:hypothetical protein